MAKAMKDKRDREVTLRDLAQRMKVNVSAVSRALGGDSGVGPEKARAIGRMASELGCERRPLRRKRTQAVGLTIASGRPEGPEDPAIRSADPGVSHGLGQLALLNYPADWMQVPGPGGVFPNDQRVKTGKPTGTGRTHCVFQVGPSV